MRDTSRSTSPRVAFLPSRRLVSVSFLRGRLSLAASLLFTPFLLIPQIRPFWSRFNPTGVTGDLERRATSWKRRS